MKPSAIITTLFIDFEAFQHGDEDFQIKELCILEATTPLKPLYFLFKPPCEWNLLSSDQRRTYIYEERYIHGLSWGEGQTRYCASCVWHYIKKSFPLTTSADHICYVLGKQKADFLRREFPQLNIVEYNVTLKELPHAPLHLTCQYRVHGEREHCAMLKCYRLLSHLRK